MSKVKFEKLELLYLGNNDIADISVFNKVNFKGLKLLDLKQNHIANINSFDINIFQNLEELNLGHNNINSSLHSTTISLLKSSVSMFPNKMCVLNFIVKIFLFFMIKIINILFI